MDAKRRIVEDNIVYEFLSDEWFIQRARQLYQDYINDGDGPQFDDSAQVSRADDVRKAGGAYVSGWVWIPLDWEDIKTDDAEI